MNFWGGSGAKECKSDRSRQELSNEYLVAKFGFDTAENEPSKVCQQVAQDIRRAPAVAAWSSSTLIEKEALQAVS